MENAKDSQQIGYARRRISANIKLYRARRNISQEALAELADFHRTYISQLERCITNVSIDGLERLAKALDVDVVDLLTPPSAGT